MRKTLLILGAAGALAASAGGVSADPVTITFDGACNAVTLTTTGNNVSASFAGTACTPGLGTGYNGKVNPGGQGTSMAVHFNSDTAVYYLFVSLPYITGGTWELRKTLDGLSTTSTSGTYSVSDAAEVHPRGTQSITSLQH